MQTLHSQDYLTSQTKYQLILTQSMFQVMPGRPCVMVNKAQVLTKRPAKRARAVQSLGRTNRITAMATVAVYADERDVIFSHVDPYAAQRFPTPVQNGSKVTLASSFWGCKEMSKLYQKYRINSIGYRYIPNVAYTWSGMVAAKIVDDPMDHYDTDSTNHFLNAPSAMITPVYMPSQNMTYRPRSGDRYCYSTQTITSDTAVQTDGAVGAQEYLTSRTESFGSLVIKAFEVYTPDGAVPPTNTLVGRLILTVDVTYMTPVPIGNDTTLRVPIYPVAIETPAPPASRNGEIPAESTAEEA